METRSTLPLLVLLLGLALAAGCGIDSAPLPAVARTPVEQLIGERSFRVGDVDVVEQVFLTNADRSQVFHLRARVTNLGSDLSEVRYELLLARERQVFARVPSVPPELELAPPEVAATQQLGTLHSSQTAVVSLSAREFGNVRVVASGRLVPGAAP